MSKLKIADNIIKCVLHKKEIEAFCLDCNILVCSNCSFIDNLHKTHSFLNLEQTSFHLRDMINDSISNQILKKEYTESKILGMKTARLEFELKTQELINNVDEVFDIIIEKAKERRNIVVDSIENNRKFQLEKIKLDEIKWREKEKITKKLLDFGTNSNDNILIENYQFILKGIADLKENVNVNELKVFTDFDINLNFENKNISLELKKNNFNAQSFNNINKMLEELRISNLELRDLCILLHNMIKLQEPQSIEYKS